MSNSIWKKPYDYNYGKDDAKEDAIIVDIGNEHYRVYQGFYDMPHHCDDPDCCFADTDYWERWAKVSDLIAQADKAERWERFADDAKKHIDGLNSMIDSWCKLMLSDLPDKYRILENAITTYAYERRNKETKSNN